jgi:2-dehydro-3-deoxygluconokinase
MLRLRDPAECRFDVVALGEVMLRLDPGEGRIRSARTFAVWEGGGEYNVARGLRRCFGLRAAVATAFADNEIGRLLEELIQAGGVDTCLIRWVPSDGVGRTVRNGLNFTERGFGLRGAVGVSDRGHSAASQLRASDVDWDYLFGTLGVRWLHTGGIFAALSESTPDTIEAAVRSARRHGTVVSYDLNYRPSLWQAVGGLARAREVTARLADLVDVMIGVDLAETGDAPAGFRTLVEGGAHPYGACEIIATALRTVGSATRNDWGAVAWSRADGFVTATHRPDLEVLDRVGSGDGFAAGLIYGLLTGQPLARAIEFGAAHGALVMTTPGDNSMATLREVEALVDGAGPATLR